MVQSAKDWQAKHAACSLDVAWNRGILIQRQVRTDFIVQQGLRTPTRPFFVRFFIGIIPGLVAESAFMRPSTKLKSFFAARSMGRKRIDGLKFRLGCLTGRHALAPGIWQLNHMSALRRLWRFLRFSI